MELLFTDLDEPGLNTLDDVQRRDRSRAHVRVLGHLGLDLGAHVLGHRCARGIGDDRRVLGEVGGLVPPRNARSVGEAPDVH